MNKILLSLLAMTIQICEPAFAQSMFKGPALIEGVTLVTTAAGTTTLTKDSQTVETLTGSTTQAAVMPDATTLPVGRYFEFYNLSTGAVTVNKNGGSLLRTLAASDHSKITLTDNSTAAGTWAVEKITISLTDSLLTGSLPVNKLAAQTASKALVSDASGFLSPSTTTSTELGYLSGVTSAIQTQLGLKAPLASPTFTGTVTTPVTASRALVTGASSELAVSATTATQLGYLSTTTSDVQTQLDSKSTKTLTNGHIFIGNASNIATDATPSGDIAITNTGVTSYSGTVPLNKGGTGQTSFGSGIIHSNGTVLSSSAVSLTADVSGTLPLGSGGTGQTTANAALNALAPTQSSNSGKFLTTDGTNTSWGVASLTAQGQDEGSGVTTTTLKAPYSQLTTIGTNTRLIETNNGNILLNPSFEASTVTSGWTLGGTSTAAAESTNIHQYAKSALITMTGTSGVSLSQDVTPTIQMSGMNLEISTWMKTAATTMKVCPNFGGVTLTSACLLVMGDSAWHQYLINYPGPASGSVGITVNTTGATTGTYYIDESYIGPARNTGTVAQAQYAGGIRQPGATNCIYGENTSSGLTTFVSLGSAGSCASAWTTLGGYVTATGTTAHTAILNGPPGDYQVKIKANFYSDTANQVCNWQLSDGTSVYEPQGTSSSVANVGGPMFEYHVPYAGGAKTYTLQASDNGAGNCYMVNDSAGRQASWDFYYFPNSTLNVTAINQAEYGWRAYTPTFTGFGTVSGVDCQEKRDSGDNLIRCKFTSGTSTAVEARVSLPGSNVVSNSLTGITYVGSSSLGAASSAQFKMLATGGQAYLTIADQGNTGGGFTKRNGNDLVSSGTALGFEARVPIEGWVSNPIPYVPGGVVSSSTSVEKINRARISITGASTCTFTQTGNWIASCTASSKIATVTFNAGYFSGAPDCFFTTYGLVADTHARYDGQWPTSTSVVFRAADNTNTAQIENLSMDCLGPN